MPKQFKQTDFVDLVDSEFKKSVRGRPKSVDTISNAERQKKYRDSLKIKINTEQFVDSNGLGVLTPTELDLVQRFLFDIRQDKQQSLFGAYQRIVKECERKGVSDEMMVSLSIIYDYSIIGLL